MVYLAKKNGAVVHHTDRAAMEALDGITPDREITDEEFEAACGLARLIDGEIFLGKTDAEITAEDNAKRVRFLKSQLASTDYIAAKIAEGSATAEEYAGQIAQRQAWRQEIAKLEATA
ncbi:hypothetical protein Holit_02226 [Hollandina sp. SP2]